MYHNNTAAPSAVNQTWVGRWKTDFKKNGGLYLLASGVILFYILFHYKPMYGIIIAFKDFAPSKGVMGSRWVGLSHFIDFFNNPYFGRLLKNTLNISISSLVFVFPMPIILALLMNELRGKVFPRTVQLIVYLPHFISLIVVCGIITKFTADRGIINDITAFFGAERISYLNYPKFFVPVYLISDIWQNMGWDSIIYLAALTSVNPELYEAAIIDGAGRWKQTLHVSIPAILPTILVMLLLRIGSLFSIGYEKIILLYNPITYETADVISTYVYRKGLLEYNWSFSTAVGLFNSVINVTLLVFANKASNKISGSGLW